MTAHGYTINSLGEPAANVSKNNLNDQPERCACLEARPVCAVRSQSQTHTH